MANTARGNSFNVQYSATYAPMSVAPDRYECQSVPFRPLAQSFSIAMSQINRKRLTYAELTSLSFAIRVE
jgi:hypothetical protein